MSDNETSATPASPEELKRRHALLLRADAGGQEGGVPAQVILTFLREVSESGRFLAMESSRDSAQGILDYWTSRVLIREPQRVAELGSYFLLDFAGTPVDNAAVSPGEAMARELSGLLGRAAAFEVPADDPGGRSLRLALLHFFKLSPGSRVPVAVPLPEASDELNRPGIRQAVDHLVEAGLVRREGEGAAAGYSLIREELLTQWDRLKVITEERRAFHDMASGWDRGGRLKAALLNRGSQLEKAWDYHDLSPTERDFLGASKTVATHLRRGFQIFLTAAALVLLGTTFYFILSTRELDRSNQLLMKTLKERDTANQEIREQKEHLEVEKAKLEEANQKAKSNALSSNYQLQQTEYLSTQLQSLAKQISNVTQLPASAQDILKEAAGSTVEKSIGDDPAGSMAEILVAGDLPAAAGKALRFTKVLTDHGVVLPYGKPLPRKRVAATTEVRYFYPEDKALAEKIRSLLIQGGFTAPILAPRYLADETAPRRFIQISVARDAL